DGPGPEEPPAGGQLELGEDEAVEELAAQVGGQGGHDQTGGTAEDAGEGGLAVEAGITGQGDGDGDEGDGNDIGEEAGPDHEAGHRVAPDLGEDVAKEVG